MVHDLSIPDYVTRMDKEKYYQLVSDARLQHEELTRHSENIGDFTTCEITRMEAVMGLFYSLCMAIPIAVVAYHVGLWLLLIFCLGGFFLNNGNYCSTLINWTTKYSLPSYIYYSDGYVRSERLDKTLEKLNKM